MRYDVFIVSVQADLEAADAVARRLRALKFKVRLDKKREHVTATPKDIKDVNQSRSVLILWSKQACNSDNPDSNWVYALAHQARSRDDALIEAGLDKTVPDEPFDEGQRYLLSGLGPRKMVAPFLALVDELGNRGSRRDLRDWIGLKASDKAGKEAWKAAHPDDPLALVGKPKPAAKSAAKAAPASAPAKSRLVPPLRMSPPAALSQKKALNEKQDTLSMLMLIAISAGIAAMFLTAYLVRSAPRAPVSEAIGNARVNSVLVCEDGQRLVCPTPILETGPIIDDTED